MTPNLAFLAKVERGEVYPYAGYSIRSGSYMDFRGGEIIANKHAEAGLIIIKMPRMIWSRGKVTLTLAGRRILHPFTTDEAFP